MAQFVERSYKSILNKRKFIDSWFWDRYSINPYNGCQFGCIYCDARSAKYHMPEDFEREIVIKKDAAEMLDKRISRARKLLPDIVGMGGVTDCYQPAETKFRNTKQLLEVLERHRWPVHVVTKSPRVLEDLELLQRIAEATWCSVSLTVTTLDEEKSKFLEGLSPTPQKRLEVISRIKKEAPAVQAGLLAIPVVPGLTDDEQGLRALAAGAAEAGADYMLFSGGMTMRDMQADWYLGKLAERHPDLIPLYEKLFAFKYDGGPYAGRYGPDERYSRELEMMLLEICEENDLPPRMPRWIPDDFRKTNYRVAEQLLNESYAMKIRGKGSQDLYWAGMNIQNMEISLEQALETGELKKVRNVRGAIYDRVVEMIGQHNP